MNVSPQTHHRPVNEQMMRICTLAPVSENRMLCEGGQLKNIFQTLKNKTMAYINAEFEHEDYDIKIEVLEPTKDERDFEDGMQIMVDFDSFCSVPLSEFREILKWMSEKADYIEENFTKKGKAKTIRIKG